MQKLLSRKMLAKTVEVGLIIIAVAVLLSLQIHKRIIASRMVKQEQIEAGWAAVGIMWGEHSIEPKDNFWKVEGHIIRTNSPISS